MLRKKLSSLQTEFEESTVRPEVSGMEDKTISHQIGFRKETKYGKVGGDSACKAWPQGKDKTKSITGKPTYKNSERIN